MASSTTTTSATVAINQDVTVVEFNPKDGKAHTATFVEICRIHKGIPIGSDDSWSRYNGCVISRMKWGNKTLLARTEKDETVGYLQIDGNYIPFFAVDPKHQGKGVGTALFQRALADCPFLTLNVRGGTKAHKFYRKFASQSLEIEERLIGYYQEGQENIQMIFLRVTKESTAGKGQLVA